MLDEAVRTLVETLDAGCAAILQSAPGDPTFLLRASAGWSDGALETAVQLEIPGRDRTWGVLAVCRPRAELTGGDIDFLESVASVIALAVERDPSIERGRAAEAALERLHAIERITDTTLQSLALDDLLQELLARVRGTLEANYASVSLIDEEHQEIYIRAVSGSIFENVRSIRAPLGHGVSGRIAADGQPRIIHDLEAIDLSQIAGTTPEEIRSVSRSVLGAPLRVGGKVVGVVTAASPEPHHFDDEKLKLLEVVADRVAPAIERARLIETIYEAQERSKTLSARLLSAQEEERRRIAMELHDELGQVLTAVKINLQRIGPKVDAQAQPFLDEGIQSVDRAMERVRNLALDLRPAMLDDLGLAAALRWYAHRFASDTGITVHFSATGSVRIGSVVETACFRVAQEALTNVMRHANARQVWVKLSMSALATELTVRDDGIGFDVAAARKRAASGVTIGILGMEERVLTLGGEFEVRSARGKGTRLTARFPSPERT